VLIGRALERAVKVVPVQERKGEPADWPLIGYAAFGNFGRRVVKSVFLGELYFILMAFLVVNGSNAQMLFPSASRSLLISTSGAMSFVLLFCPPKVFSYFSLLGHVAMGTAIVLLVVSGFSLPESPDASDYRVLRAPGLAQVVGIIVFCNVAHGTLPSTYMRCSCKKQFASVARTSFGLVGGVYMATGAVGYFFLGRAIQQNFISNIGKDFTGRPIPGLESLPFIASVGFVIKMQMSFPLYASPILGIAEATLGLTGESHTVQKALLRLVVMAGTTWLAVLLQDSMADCIALTGSLLSMCTAIIFPTACYWKLFRKELSRQHLLGLACIGAIGVYFQVTGTIDSVRQIISR